MPPDFDVTVHATTRGLDALLRALDATCAARNVDGELVSRARIVVEELFTNTIKYGYGGECDRPVRFAMDIGAALLTLTIEDEAPPFDPTAWKPPAAAAPSPADRPVGQAGITMVLGLSANAIYERLAAGNRITLVIAPRPHAD